MQDNRGTESSEKHDMTNIQMSETILIGTLLALAGGFLDAYTYICRGGVFANAQTGNIVLFSISNYFLRFSNEFRRIKGDDELDANNWYEYVEYGTTNPLTILLQRNGFSRESARFIKENPEYVVKDGSTGKLKLKASLSKCGRTSVENEVEYIRQNVPGIFVDEED